MSTSSLATREIFWIMAFRVSIAVAANDKLAGTGKAWCKEGLVLALDSTGEEVVAASQ